MMRLKSSTDHLSTRLLWFGFLSLGVVVLVYCKEPLFGLFLKSSAPSDEIRNLDTMLILVWRSGSNSTEFIIDPSTGLRCQFTGDPDLFNHSDAVIFHGDGMRLEDFPARTRSDQKWIYRTMETPVNVYPPSLKLIRLRQQRHLYNLTSTFLLRSDIPTPYFDGECQYDDSRGAGDDDQNEKLLTRVIRGKSRTAAWFVTHCTTSSRRERFVNELRRYIDVDVYGACGRSKCSLDGDVGRERFQTCDDILERDYRFYLAFENSLCEDYVTEKFWRMLDRKLIAVTLGSANYSRFLPPGVYIDVRDFSSPALLADHLRLLTVNDTLYSEYLRRKQRLKCTMRQRGNLYDRVCSYLGRNVGRVQTTDLQLTWNVDTLCQTTKSFYRQIANMVT